MVVSSSTGIATTTILALLLSKASCFSVTPLTVRSVNVLPQEQLQNQNTYKRRTSTQNSMKGDDSEDQKNGLDDEDFSFLKQWPMMPTMTSSVTTTSPSSDSSTNPSNTTLSSTSTTSSSSSSWSIRTPNPLLDIPPITSSRYRGTNPLANFVQLVEMVAPLQQQQQQQQQDSSKNSSSNIFTLADQLFRNVVDNKGGLFPTTNETTTVQDFIQQEQWFDNLQLTLLDTNRNTMIGESSSSSVEDSSSSPLSSSSSSSSGGPSRLSVTQASALTAVSKNVSGTALDALFQEATSRVEFLVQEAASLTYPSVIPDLMDQTRQLFAFMKKTENDGKTDTGKIPLLNVAEPEQLRETATYAATFMDVANTIFTSGYVMDQGTTETAETSSGVDTPKPLLADFPSADRIQAKDYQEVVFRGAEMGTLAGAIYEDTMRRSLQLGHALVARGVTANVAWMVTDSMVRGKMVRTLTIRGFDASDESVDREALLNVICSPEPVRLVDDKDILFHRGLLRTAEAIYADVKIYFDWTTADQKLVLNGHSIGGSLSILLLLLMTVDRGADYVKQKVLRVFAHGNPPIASVLKRPRGMREYLDCPVLKTFNLPSDIVYCYIQPYDPIVRLMTKYDPLYPLVDDLGSDETTLYASGPRRSLRPLTRAIFSSWDGWPEFRENWKSTNQSLQTVGIQHLLLPDPQRYLTDRFVSPNVGVPPTDQMVRISSTELLEALYDTFPLDTYQISLIPQAVRSFLHHFYPAYDSSLANYASKLSKELKVEESKTTRNTMKVETSFEFLP